MYCRGPWTKSASGTGDAGARGVITGTALLGRFWGASGVFFFGMRNVRRAGAPRRRCETRGLRLCSSVDRSIPGTP